LPFFQSSRKRSASAVAFAILSVIAVGIVTFALAFLSVIPEGDLLFAFAVAPAFA